MTNMMGAGRSSPSRPHDRAGRTAGDLGWLVALIIVLCDGMVWSELGAAMPGSGIVPLFARCRPGPVRRLMTLFVWQFVLVPAGDRVRIHRLCAVRSTSVSGLTRPWVIVLVTVVAASTSPSWIGKSDRSPDHDFAVGGNADHSASGDPDRATHFNPSIAFDFPRNAFNLSLGFFLGLGAATRIGIYDYLGYYDVCYIGDEVQNPGRVIPKSIIISTIAVAIIYVGINFSIIGVVPWREFVPAADHPASNFIVSIFMEKIYGGAVATITFGAVDCVRLGNAAPRLLEIPYAAAESGYFFKAFGRLHPTKDFPYVSVIVLGILSIIAGFFSLGTVIDALIVTRIVVQFMGQIVGLMLLRKNAPDMPRPYRMWLYPIPAFVALLGWIFVFATTDIRVIFFGVGVLALGFVAFLLWSWNTKRWPFGLAEAAS
jgi:amino acid transporter